MCKGLAIDDVGVSRDTVFQEIRPGAGFKTGDFFVEEKLGAGHRKTTHDRSIPYDLRSDSLDPSV